MKQVIIAGNIGKGAETRTTQGGDKVTGFSVAVEDRNGREKTTIWFDVTIWGARGEKLAPYLTKGGKVTVAGDLGRREHDGKTYLTVRADQITLQGGNQVGEQSRGAEYQRGGQSSGYGAGGRPSGGRNDMDDEIPFAAEWRA